MMIGTGITETMMIGIDRAKTAEELKAEQK